MNILSIIPARMGSSRFPGKPLMNLLNKPMIGHVFERVSKCQLLTKTIVATCDYQIAEYIKSIGGEAIMTSDKHERASDRCAEALNIIEEKDKKNYDIIVMVQGDEPMTHPSMIEQAVMPLINDPKILISNLLGEIKNDNELNDKNCIKVVCDLNLNALYFSREPIPTNFLKENITTGKQVCVIPFKRDFLIKYTNLDPTPLEISESIDMLRVLEHGFKVKMIRTKYISQSIDTPNDLIKVESIMKKMGDFNV